MVWLSQLTSSPYLCVAILTLAYTTNGAHYSGDTVNMLQIAPNRWAGVSNVRNICVVCLLDLITHFVFIPGQASSWDYQMDLEASPESSFHSLKIG